MGNKLSTTHQASEMT